VALFDEGAEDETADAAESVDSYFGGHGMLRRLGFAQERKGMKKGDPPAIGKRRMRLGPNNPNSAP
jgi:hypothetical protein